MDNCIYQIDLDARRRKLGMTFRALSEISGVPMPTVQRILISKDSIEHASYMNLVKIARALGVKIEFISDVDAQTMRREQAFKKAQWLVELATGSSSFEGQIINDETKARFIEQVAHKLLQSKTKLWAA